MPFTLTRNIKLITTSIYLMHLIPTFKLFLFAIFYSRYYLCVIFFLRSKFSSCFIKFIAYTGYNLTIVPLIFYYNRNRRERKKKIKFPTQLWLKLCAFIILSRLLINFEIWKTFAYKIHIAKYLDKVILDLLTC